MLNKTTTPADTGGHFKPEYTVSNTVRVKPYSKKELCNMYNIRHRQLAKWLRPFLEEIGAINGRLYTAKQVDIIFKKLGPVYDMREEV
ncbi:hypothetical protein BH11BAC4_BH11BAC4_06720 [soil metagenome]